MTKRTLTQESNNTTLAKQEALRLVAKAMDVVRHGEIVVKMENGKPVFVDALMRERVG